MVIEGSYAVVFSMNAFVLSSKTHICSMQFCDTYERVNCPPNIQHLPDDSMAACRQHIIPRLQMLAPGQRNAVMSMILEELPLYMSEDPAFAEFLGSTPFVSTRSGKLKPPRSLYDHR